jgi:hypothetical protein
MPRVERAPSPATHPGAPLRRWLPGLGGCGKGGVGIVRHSDLDEAGPLQGPSTSISAAAATPAIPLGFDACAPSCRLREVIPAGREPAGAGAPWPSSTRCPSSGMRVRAVTDNRLLLPAIAAPPPTEGLSTSTVLAGAAPGKGPSSVRPSPRQRPGPPRPGSSRHWSARLLRVHGVDGATSSIHVLVSASNAHTSSMAAQ